MIKVCHMTSAHSSTDIRIFQKECQSLASAGFDVYHVAFGHSREENGVHVVGLGTKPGNRLRRMTLATMMVYQAAKKLNCDIYHLHDPELLSCGLKLKRQGKIVIFDSHEDVPAQILDKTWIPTPLRKLVSVLYGAYETFVIKRIDAVVAATPHIACHFQDHCKKIITVNNYPKLDDIQFQSSPFKLRKAIACYAGGLDAMRGEQVMLRAMEGINGTLVLAGDHPETASSVRTDTVVYIGHIDRDAINRLYGQSVAGMVLYQPAANHYEAQPIKMFEFMAAGLPVIASNFPLWKEIIEGNCCGICVDPTHAKQVHDACVKLFNDRDTAQKMGINGRTAVEERYSWTLEEKKLIALYQQLL